MSRSHWACMWRMAVVGLGVLLITGGVYMYLNWIDIFTRLRGKEMALSATSPSFSGWKVSPLPLDFDIYLFNWTNPEEYYVGSKVKPHFVQLGPYRFRESPDKVDIEWHPHNSSVSFRKKASFHFDAAGSNGTLADRITSVNTVAHAAALQAKDANFFAKSILQTTLHMYNQGLTETKTADEWMFKGYLNPLVTMGSFISTFSSSIDVPYDRVGWMYMRNGSSTFDGHFNMYTGADDLHKMGQIHTWNHQTHNGKYPDQCGEVRGSMGEFFPPNLSTNDSISIYLPNLCRSIPLDYTSTEKIHGVTAYKFSGGERSVDNGTRYPEGKCYCVQGKCEPSGVINIAPCKYNASIYMSYPHFYKADPSYLAAVDGLQPDPAKHEFFMTLEPNAGVAMDVGGGFQANYLLEPVPAFKPYDKIPRTFIPLMWAEERVRVTPEIAADIALVPLIVLLGQIVTGALLAVGVILICWYPTKFVTQLCQDPKRKSTLLANTRILNAASNSHSMTTTTTASSTSSYNGVAKSTASTVSLLNMTYPHRALPFQPNHHHQHHQHPHHHHQRHEIEGVPLLEYKNGSLMRPNGTVVSEGLLGNTLRPPTDVIIR